MAAQCRYPFLLSMWCWMNTATVQYLHWTYFFHFIVYFFGMNWLDMCGCVFKVHESKEYLKTVCRSWDALVPVQWIRWRIFSHKAMRSKHTLSEFCMYILRRADSFISMYGECPPAHFSGTVSCDLWWWCWVACEFSAVSFTETISNEASSVKQYWFSSQIVFSTVYRRFPFIFPVHMTCGLCKVQFTFHRLKCGKFSEHS